MEGLGFILLILKILKILIQTTKFVVLKRFHLTGHFQMKLSQEQFIINAKGKKTGVILSMPQYQQLLEDLHDLAIVAERRQEPTLTLAELKKRLRKPIHHV